MKQHKYKHKRRNQRNWKLPVSIGGFILIGCLVLGMVVSMNYIKKIQDVKETQEALKQQEDVVQKEELPSVSIDTVEDIRITISAAGDCTFATDVNYAGGPTFVAKYNEVQDPSYFLRNVQEIL